MSLSVPGGRKFFFCLLDHMAPKRKQQSDDSFSLSNKTQTVKLVIQEESPPPRPVEYAVLQSKLRTNQRRLRQLEATLADVFTGDGGAPMSLHRHVSSSRAADMNLIGNKAEALVQFRKESRTFEDNVKRAELLARQLEMLGNQERILRQSLNNSANRIVNLQRTNTRRILQERARGNQANEVIIRQEHNAAVQLLRAEARGIREKLRGLLEQKEMINVEFKQASDTASRLEAVAREARLKASQAAQNISRVASQSRGRGRARGRGRGRGSGVLLQRTKTTKSTSIRPPTMRR